MVKHIVMWKIQGVNGQSKEETAQEIKRTLEDLNGKKIVRRQNSIMTKSRTPG